VAKKEVQRVEAEDLTTPIVGIPIGTSPWNPQVSQLMNTPGLTPSERRRGLRIALGLSTPRKKYKSKKERKKAAKERREKRKEERSALYEKYGLTPRTRGPKLTSEQKKEKRSERGKKRRAALRDLARANPEKAKEYGIDISRFKL